METQRKSNIGGVIGLLLVFTLVGVVFSWLYLGLIDVIPYAWPRVLIAAFFGTSLGFVVKMLKKGFKITSAAGPLLAVIISLLIINFMRYQMFFAIWYSRLTADDFYWWFENSYLRPLWQIPEFLDALAWIFSYPFDPANNTTFFGEFISDLRWFNEVGTWSWDGNDITGPLLTGVWIIELLLISVPAISAALIPVGVFLYNKNTWADPRFLTYEFEEFSEEELDRLERGDIDVVTNKPLASIVHRGRVSKIAVCYLGSDSTEYIAVFRTKAGKSNDDNSKMPFGRPRVQRAIKLGYEKVGELQLNLEEKHGHMMVQTPEYTPEQTTEYTQEQESRDE